MPYPWGVFSHRIDVHNLYLVPLYCEGERKGVLVGVADGCVALSTFIKKAIKNWNFGIIIQHRIWICAI